MQNTYSWDQYFMSIAYMVSMKSKDISTRVGALIVGKNNEIRATGYNGFPRGITDTYERYADRERKYMLITHAEENAILQCARNGVVAEDCKVYVPWIPCCRCATSIIQAGIKEVIFDKNFPGNDDKQQRSWQHSISIAKDLMNEAGVLIRHYDGPLITIQKLYNGEKC
ncbi:MULTISPECIES: dCMP deaminase family protein [unclassified Candidatus Lariskella]|uniref:deoxycytidylate deaminase n=1 Tax=unclassified Candidatus Lariskella TaxID=2632605 RepID=UPI0030CB7D1B